MEMQGRFISTNFTGGELSPLLRGRVDINKYYNSAATMLNMIPYVHGGCTRRTGSKFVAEVKDSTKATRLLPFKFSTTQNYILEFGHLYMRVYKDRGVVDEAAKTITGITKANPGVVTSAAHGYSNGDQIDLDDIGGMVELNGRRVTAANVAANTFELSGINTSSYTTYTSGGTASRVYTLVTPWTEDDLVDLKITQSADTLFICHPLYRTRKITRTSDTAWTITTYDNKDGPYLPLNTTATTLTPSGTTGSITVTASAATFASTDVARLIRIQEGGAWSWLEITAYTSSTQVTATVRGANLAATTATTNWRLGAWSNTTGWPACITLFQERAVFGASTTKPQTIWGSKTGDFEDHAPTAADGTVADNNGFTFTISDDQVNAIRWLSSGNNAIGVGTSDAEYQAYGGNSNGAFAAITPTNITISRETTHGSVSNTRMKRIGNEVIFIQPSRRKVRSNAFNNKSDGYEAKDVTLLAEHITKTGIIDFDYQEELTPIGWFVRTDGVLLGMTYNKTEDVIGWHKHIIGGTDSIVESVSVIESPDATEGQDLWFVVQRTINGSSKRYIEYLTPPFDSELNFSDSMVFLDGMKEYDGFLVADITLSAATVGTGRTVTASTSVFTATMVGSEVHQIDNDGLLVGRGVITGYSSGTSITMTIELAFSSASVSAGEWAIAVDEVGELWHLEGDEVNINADAGVLPNGTVALGSVGLNDFYRKVKVGYNYTSRIKTLPVEVSSPGQSVQGLIQKVSKVIVYFYETLGARFGVDTSSLEQIPTRAGSDPMDNAPPLFTGIKQLKLSSGYTREASVIIQQDLPLPLTVLFVVKEIEVSASG